jgi:hypothetical protein
LAAVRARNDRRLGALAPHLELFDRGGTKRIAGRHHDFATFRTEFRGKLADGGGLARAIDADHEDDEWLLRRVDLQRPRHRRQHLFDFGRDDRLHLVGRNRLVVTAGADGIRDAYRHGRAEIGAQQHILDIVEHGAVELALGDEVGNGRAERTRGPLQAARKPPPPAQFGGSGSGIAHVGDVLAVSRHERKSQPTYRCSRGIP